MQISFYVLSDHKAQDLLGFITQLTQTALNKSKYSVAILVEEDTLLSALDDALWAQDASSFIPHQRLPANDNTADKTPSSQAPVLLGAYLPSDFNGIVINTTSHPVNDFITTTSNKHPTRVLEIIKPDTKSVQEGRDKYKRYQQLNYELTHFKV